jgi:hypothetical protein
MFKEARGAGKGEAGRRSGGGAGIGELSGGGGGTGELARKAVLGVGRAGVHGGGGGGDGSGDCSAKADATAGESLRSSLGARGSGVKTDPLISGVQIGSAVAEGRAAA